MTSRPDNIQALIAEIDTIIGRATEQLHGAPADAVPQELALLQQIRRYLDTQSNPSPDTQSNPSPDTLPDTLQGTSRVVSEQHRDIPLSPLRSLPPMRETAMSQPNPSSDPTEMPGYLDAIELENIVRSALSLDPPFSGSADSSPAMSSSPSNSPSNSPTSTPGTGSDSSESGLARDIMVLHSSLLQPLRHDLDTLRQERDRLASEIQHLQTQAQYQNSLLQQQSNQERTIATFVSTLQDRLQHAITQQLGGMLQTLETRLVNYFSAYFSTNRLPDSGATSSPVLHPAQRFEQVQRLQADSDRLLLELDGKLQTSFNAVLSNIRSYEDSLATSVEKMHRLSQQGDAIVQALVDRAANVLPSGVATTARDADEIEATIDPAVMDDDDGEVVDLSDPADTAMDMRDRAAASFGVASTTSTTATRAIVPPPERITALTDLTALLETPQDDDIQNEELPFGEFIVPLEPETVAADSVMDDSVAADSIAEISDTVEAMDVLDESEGADHLASEMDAVADDAEAAIDDTDLDRTDFDNIDRQVDEQADDVEVSEAATGDEVSDDVLSIDSIVETDESETDDAEADDAEANDAEAISTIEPADDDRLADETLSDDTSAEADETVSGEAIGGIAIAAASLGAIASIANTVTDAALDALTADEPPENPDNTETELSLLESPESLENTDVIDRHEDFGEDLITAFEEEAGEEEAGEEESSPEESSPEASSPEASESPNEQDSWLLEDASEESENPGIYDVRGTDGEIMLDDVINDAEPNESDVPLRWNAIPEEMQTGLDSRWFDDDEDANEEIDKIDPPASSEVNPDLYSFAADEADEVDEINHIDEENDDLLGDPIDFEPFDLGDTDTMDLERATPLIPGLPAETPRTIEEIARDLSQRNATSDHNVYIRPTEIESGLAAFFDLPSDDEDVTDPSMMPTMIEALQAPDDIEIIAHITEDDDVDEIGDVDNDDDPLDRVLSEFAPLDEPDDDVNASPDAELFGFMDFEAIAAQVIAEDSETDLIVENLDTESPDTEDLDTENTEAFDEQSLAFPALESSRTKWSSLRPRFTTPSVAHTESDELDLTAQEIEDVKNLEPDEPDEFDELDAIAEQVMMADTDSITENTTATFETIADPWSETAATFPDDDASPEALSTTQAEPVNADANVSEADIDRIDLNDTLNDTDSPEWDEVSTVEADGIAANAANSEEEELDLEENWNDDFGLDDDAEVGLESFGETAIEAENWAITDPSDSADDPDDSGDFIAMANSLVSDFDADDSFVDIESDEADFDDADEADFDDFATIAAQVLTEDDDLPALDLDEETPMSAPTPRTIEDDPAADSIAVIATDESTDFASDAPLDSKLGSEFDSELDTDLWTDNTDENLSSTTPDISANTPATDVTNQPPIADPESETDSFEFDPSTFGQDSEISAEDNWAEDDFGDDLSDDLSNEPEAASVLPQDEHHAVEMGSTDDVTSSALEGWGAVEIEDATVADLGTEVADEATAWGDESQEWEDNNDWYDDDLDDSEELVIPEPSVLIAPTLDRTKNTTPGSLDFESDLGDESTDLDLSLEGDLEDGDEFLLETTDDQSADFSGDTLGELIAEEALRDDDLDFDDSEIFGMPIVEEAEPEDVEESEELEGSKTLLEEAEPEELEESETLTESSIELWEDVEDSEDAENAEDVIENPESNTSEAPSAVAESSTIANAAVDPSEPVTPQSDDFSDDVIAEPEAMPNSDPERLSDDIIEEDTAIDFDAGLTFEVEPDLGELDLDEPDLSELDLEAEPESTAEIELEPDVEPEDIEGEYEHEYEYEYILEDEEDSLTSEVLLTEESNIPEVILGRDIAVNLDLFAEDDTPEADPVLASFEVPPGVPVEQDISNAIEPLDEPVIERPDSEPDDISVPALEREDPDSLVSDEPTTALEEDDIEEPIAQEISEPEATPEPELDEPEEPTAASPILPLEHDENVVTPTEISTGETDLIADLDRETTAIGNRIDEDEFLAIETVLASQPTESTSKIDLNIMADLNSEIVSEADFEVDSTEADDAVDDDFDALLAGMTTPKTTEISQNKNSDLNLFESAVVMPSSSTPDPNSLVPSAEARLDRSDLVNDLLIELESESQHTSSSNMAKAFDWFDDETDRDRNASQTRETAAADIDRELSIASPDARRTAKLDAIDLEASGVAPSDRAPNRPVTATGDGDEDDDDSHSRIVSSRGGPPAIEPDIPAASDPKAQGAEVSNSLTSAPTASPVTVPHVTAPSAVTPIAGHDPAIAATSPETSSTASTATPSAPSEPVRVSPNPQNQTRPLAPQSSLQARPNPVPPALDPAIAATADAEATENTENTEAAENTDRPIAHKKAALKQQFSELPALDEWEAVSVSAPVLSSIHDQNDRRETESPPPASVPIEAESHESHIDLAPIVSSETPIDWALDLFEDTDPYPDERIEPLPVDRDLDETIARLSEHITDDFVALDLPADDDRYALINPGSIDLATLSPAELAEIANDNPFDSTDDEYYGYRGVQAGADTENPFPTLPENTEDDGDNTDDDDDAADEALFDAILEIVNDWSEPNRADPPDELGDAAAIDSTREAQIEAELTAKLGLDGLERELEAAIIAAMQQVDPAASLAPPSLSLPADSAAISNEDREDIDPAELFTSIWDTLPPPPTPNDPPNNRWYLALDLGVTELSAVLIDRQTNQRYPLAWSQANDSTSDKRAETVANSAKSETFSHPPTELRYRLPCAVYLSPEATSPDDWTIGSQALIDSQNADRAAERDQILPGILIQDFRSCFEIGISWRDDRDAFQPIVRWSIDDRLSLYELRHALRRLLTSLRCDALADGCTLEPDTDRLVDSQLPKLAGIIVNQHSESNAAYRFNLREAMIEAGLVSHPGQITFVDAAWASVRSQVLSPDRVAQSEKTLVVTADAAAIEFLVCEVTGDRSHHEAETGLQRRSHRVPYGRMSLELDVIGQLLLVDDRLNLAIADDLDSLTNPLTNSLNSKSPALPPVGEPAPEARIALRQWLQTTPQGRSLLRVARDVLQCLQAGQDRAIVPYVQTEIQIWRRQFETAVLIPAIAEFNRELNHFFSRIGTAVQSIDRVILSGDASHWPSVETWLRQKCPNATLIQSRSSDPRISITADGLAGLINPDPDALPVANLDRECDLDLDRQRYDDYFVFHELLCNLPQQAMTRRDACNLLERAGIPAAIADRQLPALLVNHLPIGLIPTAPLSQWIDPDSIGHPIYQVLRESPLFESGPQDAPIKFQPKFQHIAWMRQYLYCLTMSTAQTFQDPLCLVVGWTMPTTIHR